MNNYSASGSSTLGGGVYGSIDVSGSLLITGDVQCQKLFAASSCRCDGGVTCEDTIKCAGSFSAGGPVRAKRLEGQGSVKVVSFSGGDVNCSGSFQADGPVEAQSMNVSGSAKLAGFTGGNLDCSGSLACAGDIRAGAVACSGSVRCADLSAERLDCSGRLVCRNLSAEEADISGGLEAAGQVNVGSLHLCLSGAPSNRAESVVGGRIIIEAGHFGRLLGLAGRPALFETRYIEGDELELEQVQAELVRGAAVHIGKNCRIGRVEYTGSLEVDPSAQVGETEKS